MGGGREVGEGGWVGEGGSKGSACYRWRRWPRGPIGHFCVPSALARQLRPRELLERLLREAIDCTRNALAASGPSPPCGVGAAAGANA